MKRSQNTRTTAETPYEHQTLLQHPEATLAAQARGRKVLVGQRGREETPGEVPEAVPVDADPRCLLEAGESLKHSETTSFFAPRAYDPESRSGFVQDRVIKIPIIQ